MIRFMAFQVEFPEPESEDEIVSQAMDISKKLVASLSSQGWECTAPAERASLGCEFVVSKDRRYMSCALHFADTWYLACDASLPLLGGRRRAHAAQTFKHLCDDVEATLTKTAGVSNRTAWMDEHEFHQYQGGAK